MAIGILVGAAAKKSTSDLAPLIALVAIAAVVVVYVWVCVLIARAAVAKGRSYRAWFAIAFFVSQFSQPSSSRL
jgi:hypothetical protein